MGYCIYQEEAEFFIDRDRRAAALASLKGAVRGKPDLRWIKNREILAAQNLAEAITECGWRLRATDDGDITGIQFWSEKLGDEELIFSAIAPHVRAGSFIEMRGEDGDRWRWEFDGKGMRRRQARVVWD